MRKAVLIRNVPTDQGTAGFLITDHGWTCCTLELPWRNNQSNISCICAGDYKVTIYSSPRFGKSYRLEDKNGRTYVLMHSANFAGDKALGYKTHLEGCIALGKYHGELPNHHGKQQLAVLSSRPTIRAFMKEMGSEPFTLTIIGDQHVG